MNKKQTAKVKKTISTKELEEKFDRGESVLEYFDKESAMLIKKINVDFPVWMIDELDKEACRIGIARQALIRVLVDEKLRERKKELEETG
jgi:hypothetical protein